MWDSNRQSIEQFMRDFFHDRTVEEEREIANRAPYRKKYFAEKCRKDSRDGVVDMYKSSHIESVSTIGSEVLVIVTFKVPILEPENQIQRERYHLEAAGNKWLIQKVEVICPMCKGQGDETCLCCKGQHWR
jgi:hypothetical protein